MASAWRRSNSTSITVVWQILYHPLKTRTYKDHLKNIEPNKNNDLEGEYSEFAKLQFYYKLEGENVVYQFFPVPDEFVALADMFRNEGPINFNTSGKYFITAAEEIGEEETEP